MKDLQEATERICDLKGNVMALEAVIAALLRSMPADQLPVFEQALLSEQEAGTAVLLGASVSEWTAAAFERDVQRVLATADRLRP